MHLQSTYRLWRATALASLLAALCWFALAYVQPAYADSVIVNCTTAGLQAALGGANGTLTFNCGPTPVVITVTDNGGLDVLAGKKFTLDGGDKITLNAAHNNRLFDVRVGGALTLTHIILTDGYQDGAHGNLPDSGGAILAEGLSLTLDHVTIRNSQSPVAGGALEIITGTVLIKDSLIEGNQSGMGGGVDSAGPLALINRLTLQNTTVRSNHTLILGGGGGLNVGGVVVINDSLISGNTVQGGPGGGLRIASSGHVSILDSRLEGNTTTGAANEDGGGLSNDGVLTLTRNIVRGNSAAKGGGLHNTKIALVDGSTFDGNTANAWGGGIYSDSLGQLYLSNSTVSRNTASNGGGGIYNSGLAQVNNVLLSGNTAKVDAGGGIYMGGSEGFFSLVRSSVSGNLAINGGGIYNVGPLEVSDSTLSGNQARSDGGGIFNADYSALLQNVTLSGNIAAGFGGGIDNAASLSLMQVTISDNAAATGGGLYNAANYTAALTNTILAYSPSGGNCFGTLTAVKYTSSSDPSCGLSGMINGVSANNLDPLLTALGDYGGPKAGVEQAPILVHMLIPGSKAIGGVLGSDALTADERGLPRPGADGGYDLGAVERQDDETILAPHLYLPLLQR